jgi:hypothetical protein
MLKKERKMKRLVNAVVTVLSIFALSISGAVVAQAAELNSDLEYNQPNPYVEFELMFDGFCDGMTLELNTETGMVTGVYESSCATCQFSNMLEGIVINRPFEGALVTLSWDLGLTDPLGIFTVIRHDGTWAHYDFLENEVNSGTWSFCSRGTPAYETNVPSTYDLLFEDADVNKPIGPPLYYRHQ